MTTSDASTVALVTGAASGLGRGIALRLAADGAEVVLLDRDPRGLEETTELIAPAGVAVSSHVVDVVDDEAIRAALAAVVQAHGQIHWVVNAAGIGPLSRLLDITPGDWDECLAVNLKGTFLVCQAFVRHILERGGGGAIVNIASMASRMGSEPLLHYSASKAGVVEFGHGLARDYARYGLRVNAVLPGLIWTPLQRQAMRQVRSDEQMRDQLGLTEEMSEEEIFAKFASTIPLGIAPTPEDVAACVAFLLGDQARSVTGQSIAVDGGITMGW